MKRISLKDQARPLGILLLSFLTLASLSMPAAAQTHQATAEVSPLVFLSHERPRVLPPADDRYVPHHWVPWRSVLVRHRVNSSPPLLARTRAERFHAERRLRYNA